ncbi:MAG: hypothetical protein QNJ68_17860 [Microcoleaceae cyanobacterium MO_207.B10]|nr:hypothetical protein [Microcoleaceae cyanobacterium MO_207.B10]
MKPNKGILLLVLGFGSSTQPTAHGGSYEEALENAKEVLADLVSAYEEMGKPLPQLQSLQTI